ncbi:MAG: LuxR C-terminal-related transcriptional regulator, partial [Treponema sp.]|nr:LuxR C-terminal-related transcriptional regulator [Treponema sp.]
GGLIRLIESLPRILPRGAASFFLEVTERLIADPEEDGDDEDFLFLSFIIRPRLLMFLNCFEKSAGECRRAVARFEAQNPGPGRSRFLWAAYNNLGTLGIFSCRYTRDYTFARWFEQGCRYYQENPEPVHGQMSQSNIGSYMLQVGYPAAPGEAENFIEAYAAVVPFASASLGGYLYGTDSLARAELAYYQGDLTRAEQFARQAVYQCREKKQYEAENRALFYLMRIGIHRGDLAEIREPERQMEAQLENGEYLNRYNIHDITMGRFYARLGLNDRIAPWLRTEQGEEELNVLFRGFDTLVKARCLFNEKNDASALRILEEEQARKDLGSFLLGMLEETALEAVIRHRLGDREGALRALKRAYDAARPHNLNMPFVELGEYMLGLINAQLKILGEGKDGDAENPDADGGIPREWLNTIRRDASAYAKKRSLIAAQYSGRDAAPPDFSEWEREIINKISQGRTAEEISAGLNISVKMVKSSIRSIYAKLGAVNRADAIRIATSRGLLTGPDLH